MMEREKGQETAVFIADDPFVFRIDLRTGDTLLLCSDGLSNQVTDREIAGVLLTETDLGNAGEKLMSMALDRGAPDNVTVLLAKI